VKKFRVKMEIHTLSILELELEASNTRQAMQRAKDLYLDYYGDICKANVDGEKFELPGAEVVSFDQWFDQRLDDEEIEVRTMKDAAAAEWRRPLKIASEGG